MALPAFAPSFPVTLFLAVVVALAVVGLVSRPWLMLLPFVWVFSWVKGLFAIPTNINKALAFFALERDAAALAHNARTAEALWSAGPEFRAAARAAFTAVAASYGVQPSAGDVGSLSVGDFAAAQVASAADAVAGSRGGLKAAPK